jgi:hypothetical protein
MSITKANHYIDTALWFFSPRAFTALKLNELVCSCEGLVIDPSIFMINDFECQRSFEFGAGNDRLMIMDNPYSHPDNLSQKVGAYTDPANDAWAALCAVFPDTLDLSTFNVLMVDVYSPAADVPFLLKLEGGTGTPAEVWVNTTAANAWETLTADFSAQADAKYTRICIFPNGGVESPVESTYFLDNLRLGLATGIFTPSIEQLEISPNPVDHILYIKNPGEATQFRMINAMGQQVLETKSEGQDITPMIVGHLYPGFYMVVAYNSEGKLIANARIIKN